MMDYKNFKKELIAMLPDFLPEDLKTRGVELESVVTTNDQRRDCLTPAGTTEGLSGKPIIYLDDLYQQYHDGGLSMETTCFLVAGHLAESMHHIPDVNGIDQQIRPDNIFIALVNH